MTSTSTTDPRTDQATLFRPPRPLAVLVLIVLLGELLVAWTTAGTPDIDIWQSFATTAGRVGPIDIYSLSIEEAGLMVYNHPPLIGWWLQVVNAGVHLGLPFAFMIRLPSVLAHALTTLLVYQLLRTRVAPRTALLSAALVGASPILLIIAGFHGNNDPVMAMLTIASVWLLVDRRRPVWAGLAFGIAVSVKIVPVIVAPLLLVAAWRLGRPVLVRFVAGALPVFVVLWIPVLALAGPGFIEHVLGYNGSGFPRQWGPYKFAESLHVPGRLLNLYSGLGTYLVLAASALVPAWFIRNTPKRAPAALGLCLSLFLLISPGWAPQYTSWIAAVVFLIELWPAALFTAVAGPIYVVLYTQWSGYRVWDYAAVTTLSKGQMAILAVAWLSLIPVVVVGVLRFLRPAPPGDEAGLTSDNGLVTGKVLTTDSPQVEPDQPTRTV